VLVHRLIRVISCYRQFIPSDVVVFDFDLLQGEGRLRLPELLCFHATPERGVNYLRRMKKTFLTVRLSVLILVGPVAWRYQSLVVTYGCRVSRLVSCRALLEGYRSSFRQY